MNYWGWIHDYTSTAGKSSVLDQSADTDLHNTAQGLGGGRGGRPGLPVPNSPYDLCGREAIIIGTGSTQLRSSETFHRHQSVKVTSCGSARSSSSFNLRSLAGLPIHAILFHPSTMINNNGTALWPPHVFLRTVESLHACFSCSCVPPFYRQ